MVRPFSFDFRLANAMISSIVGIWKRPLNCLGAFAERLDGAQRLDLGQSEIGGEPPRVRGAIDDDCALAVGELGMAADVRRTYDVRLVTRDHATVFGHHEIRLDEISSELYSESIVLQRVVREVAGGAAAMTDDERCPGRVAL